MPPLPATQSEPAQEEEKVQSPKQAEQTPDNEEAVKIWDKEIYTDASSPRNSNTILRPMDNPVAACSYSMYNN